MNDSLKDKLPAYTPDGPCSPAPTPLAPWWRRALLTTLDAVHPRTAVGLLRPDADPYEVSRLR
ncbi:MAG: hypothetical protein NVV66_18640 [Cellulomonas sp.]|uniref:hypothetical protein n=1 Tax=Cellulomonas sp. TaxID=40001 RepID=UPI002589B9D9|nr:hypothetical protein [Cellulomonas sp.]MCR6706614.1 hypothetical protein [Cellulomonas sp.]